MQNMDSICPNRQKRCLTSTIQITNVLLTSLHTDTKTGEVNKTSAIHPIVIRLLPAETSNPHTLTEVQFFLLETKM